MRALPRTLAALAVPALVCVLLTACDRGAAPSSAGSEGLPPPAGYSADRGDSASARADRWRKEHADWAAAKKQRSARFEGDNGPKQHERLQVEREDQ